MARLYRVEMTLNQNDMIQFIDQNPGYKALITAVEPPAAAGQPVETYKPERAIQRRKRRTKAQIEADTAAARLKAAE
jgi:hypothetical protein